MVVAQGWGEGRNGKLLFIGYRVSAGEGEKFLEINGGDGYTAIFLMPLNFILKNG